MSAGNLIGGIEFSVERLRAKKVCGEVKLCWSCSLAWQVEALVKVAEALNRIGGKSSGDMDLASFLSQLNSKVPKRFVRRNFAAMIGKRRGTVYRR